MIHAAWTTPCLWASVFLGFPNCHELPRHGALQEHWRSQVPLLAESFDAFDPYFLLDYAIACFSFFDNCCCRNAVRSDARRAHSRLLTGPRGVSQAVPSRDKEIAAWI